MYTYYITDGSEKTYDYKLELSRHMCKWDARKLAWCFIGKEDDSRINMFKQIGLTVQRE